jgi:hypothetical protein
MSSLIAFFLGILVVLVIFIPFWYLGRSNATIKPVYESIFCSSGIAVVKNYANTS